MSQTYESGGEESGLKDEAAARVQEAASMAQEKMSDLKDRGSSRLESELETRSTTIGSQLTSMAGALRSSGSRLDGQGNPAATLSEPAAEQLERLGSYLQQSSGDQLLSDFESFARQRPWMLMGAGVLAGIAAARFVKASSDRRSTAYRSAYRPSPVRTGSSTPAAGTVGTIGRQPYSEPSYSAR